MTWICPFCERQYPDSSVGVPRDQDADAKEGCTICWVSPAGSGRYVRPDSVDGGSAMSDLAEFGVETVDGSDADRDRHDHCSLCGSELEFESEADTDQCIAKTRSQDYQRCEHNAVDGDSLCQTHLRAHRKNGSVIVRSDRLDQLPDRGSCPTEGCPR